MKKILVVVDMQNDFIDGALGTPEAVAIVPHVKEKIESITFVGLCTDICVSSNAMVVKAFYPEIPLTVDARCCAGVTPESHARALAAMKVCQIKVDNEEI